MMKLFLLLGRPNNQQSCHQASRVLLFSTQAAAITPLRRMIMRTEDRKASVVPILENWVQQGNEIEHSQLRNLISNLTSLDRFHHALQISQWMSGKGGYELHSANLECEKAEAILSRLRESGIEAEADTLDRLALAYCDCEQMDKAVETFVKAISVSKPGWMGGSVTMYACLDHLESKGDGGVAREELAKMLTERFDYVPGVRIPLIGHE